MTKQNQQGYRPLTNIGVVFNFSASGAGPLRVHVPLQIGAVFNRSDRNKQTDQVHVPL